ncbi:hypothetical protein [Chryseobacterium vrystaatense]|uniref:Uncharacterized protein n=1 Tax=Chryseobacterium vrystaatense TaxID=307480 RepID=A0A1M4UWD3_9FLAO|nr:hypothetical protein [Chryseobacterium vrystaatense]SHE61005.1 hypothetical protein SAMN02787073_0739 [Chryseobacterium vrystaatense]
MFRKFINVKTSHSNSTFQNLQEVINYIKDSSRPEIKEIQKLKTLEKGTQEYDNIKQSCIPSILWNFTTNGGKKLENSIQSTGYIYFDIDNNLDFQFNPEYFTAHWKSVSGKGLGCLVKVSGVNKSNFKEAFKYIAEKLLIPSDPKVNNINRLNILPFDPDIGYNEHAQTIDCSFLSNNDTNDIQEENNHSVTKFSFINSCQWNDEKTSIRYDNLEEKKSEIQIIYDKKGVCDLKDNKLIYSSIKIPKNIIDGKRNYILSGIAIKIIALNPKLPNGKLIEFMRKINQSCCKPPMLDDEIVSICKTLLDKREKWLPVDNAKKRFFFDPSLKLSIEQKQSLVRTYVNKHRGEIKKQLVRDSFAGLLSEGKKFKIKDIQAETRVSPTTIRKYLSEILIEEYGGQIEDIQPFFNANKQIKTQQ